MDSAADVARALRAETNPERALHALRFFKAGAGEYAEHDKFLGNSVPQIRVIAKQAKGLPFPELEKLLTSVWHEERLAALLILVGQYAKAEEANKKAIYDFYLSHTKWINNWDLVGSSAEFIVGPYLEDKPEKMAVLTKLANSDLLWERRIAVLATFDYIKKRKADEALVIAEKLLNDKHDLIQKAVGWMLREIEKRVGVQILLDFLDKFAATMPRTSLRYAIEHLTPEQKAYYLGLKAKLA